jgi:hypothetical protein
MAKITKKYMLEDYPRLERKASLLDLYMHDIENGKEPDAVEIVGSVRGKLLRANSATGGYIVVFYIPDLGQTGNTWMSYLDDADKGLRACEHNLDLRIVIERLRAHREGLCRKDQSLEAFELSLDNRNYAWA